MTSAVAKLQPSRLSDQRELLKDDLDLSSLDLIGQLGNFNLREAITSASATRTIDGGSQVNITVRDRDLTLLRSGFVTSEQIVQVAKAHSLQAVNAGFLDDAYDINIDGLWFRLVGFAKNGRDLRLIFESREVALLRSYPRPGAGHSGFLSVPASKTTRWLFAKRLVQEVKEVEIPFYCPDLGQPNPVTGSEYLPDSNTAARQHDYGLTVEQGVTVKGTPATKTQIANLEAVLKTGQSMQARRKILVAAVMTVTQESAAETTATNGTHVGLFQQDSDPKSIWTKLGGATRDPAADAHAFYQTAIPLDKTSPGQDDWKLCEAVQHSGQGTLYAQWRAEAEHTVTEYFGQNQVGGNATVGVLAAQTKPFTRGRKATVNGKFVYTREDNWACLQRLAAEVGYRCFECSGAVHLISDDRLLRQKLAATITEGDPGIDSIDCDFDSGKKQAQITVPCRIGRWQAPPGSAVAVTDMGPLNGRWLTTDVQRDLFTPAGTITLKKPQPTLPEARAPEFAQTSNQTIFTPKLTPSGTTDSPGKKVSTDTEVRVAIANAARKAIQAQHDTGVYRYQEVAGEPVGSLFGPAPRVMDCSLFAQLCYKAGGAADPNGFGYRRRGNTVTLVSSSRGEWTNTPRPGDLVFYGPIRTAPNHVAVYLGDSRIANMGSPGEPVEEDVLAPATGVAGPLIGTMTYRLLP